MVQAYLAAHSSVWILSSPMGWPKRSSSALFQDPPPPKASLIALFNVSADEAGRDMNLLRLGLKRTALLEAKTS